MTYVGKDTYVCQECGNTEHEWTYTGSCKRRPSMYERTRAAVYATGNKWAIENFHATHD